VLEHDRAVRLDMLEVRIVPDPEGASFSGFGVRGRGDRTAWLGM
jgi:hypothetical protein